MEKTSIDDRGLIRILLVDDDLIFRKNFAAILRENGYNVELAESGNEAISQLNLTHFDIVFLDIKLPDINGIEVFKKIKETSPKTNVIVITAFPIEKLGMGAFQEETFTYFCKPFDINTVLRLIEETGG